jgi:hypothetical protein
MAITHTKQSLIAHLTAVFGPEQTDLPLPPEFYVIKAVVTCLPEEPQDLYIVYDPEEGEIPAGIYGLGGIAVGSWSGEDPGSWGYGDLELLYTVKGPGVKFSISGSSLQSACTVWILPASLEGWLA